MSTTENEAEKVARVHCKRRGRSVTLATCDGCVGAIAASAITVPPAIDAVVRCRTPRAPAAASMDAAEHAARTTLGEVMERDIACVAPDYEWKMLVDLLVGRGFDAAPVVDVEGRPLGIITKTDLLRATAGTTFGATAADLMTPLVHALPEDVPLSFALSLLALEDVEQVPVVATDGVVVGLITARDVVRWLAERFGYVVGTTFLADRGR